MKLPDFPVGFTASFLTELLGREVSDVSVSSLGEGTGMMAEMSRLSFQDNREAVTMIAKYSSSNPTNREVALSFNLYEREARYYAELDAQTELATPEIYYSAVDGDNLLILMEDLANYEVGSQVIGATLEQSELAVQELAKLHGAFWGKVDDLSWVPGIARSFHADNMYNFSQVGWDVMADTFNVAEQLAPYKDAFIDALPRLQEAQYSEPRTFLHGDFRMENLLYGTKPGHYPVATIDFQGPLTGQGFVDVALFLCQSTKTDVRREHESALLSLYLAGLASLGIELDPVDAWQRYRQAVLYNWVYTAVVAGTLDTSNETAFAWMQQMVNRQLAASQDLQVFELL